MHASIYSLARFWPLLTVAFLATQVHGFGAQDPGAEWTGTWQTHWRNGGAILRFRQTGSTVVGTYPLYDGSVEAAVEGRKLNGRWTEASGRSGKFFFILASDARTFMGRFDSGEWWTGTRLSSSVDYARRLYEVLDALTFRIWGLPGPSLPGSTEEPSVVVTLAQAGTTNTFDLHFARKGENWLMEPPTKEALTEALKRLYAAHGGEPPTRSEHLLLRNPRDTMRTFIEEMGRLEVGGRTNVLRALDLRAFGVVVQEEEAALIAQYLKQVLDRIGLVLYQEIPNDPNQREAYVHFQHGAGNIVIAPFTTAEGETEWRFTSDTLHGLRSRSGKLRRSRYHRRPPRRFPRPRKWERVAGGRVRGRSPGTPPIRKSLSGIALASGGAGVARPRPASSG